MIITKLASGKAFSLYAIVINNNCLVQDYIDSLEPKMQKQLFALFQLVIENGPPNDKRKFNPIGDKIYELKTRSGVRILCFYGGSLLQKSLILTHGFDKPHQKILIREKEKAVNWHKDFLRHAEII